MNVSLNDLLKVMVGYEKIENRTPRQELEYNYVDRTYQYYSLLKTAKELGNKKPNENLLIKNAYENMVKAHNELANFKGA